MNIGKIPCNTFSVLAVALIMSLGTAAQAATVTSNTTTHHERLRGFSTLDAARTACGGDAVVWHAKDSKVFHGTTSKYFGRTKGGAYVCEKAAIADHLRASKY